MSITEAIDKILSKGIDEADYSRFYFRNDDNSTTVLEHVSAVCGQDITKEELDLEMRERARRSLDRLYPVE